jgi:hypothetical protein
MRGTTSVGIARTERKERKLPGTGNIHRHKYYSTTLRNGANGIDFWHLSCSSLLPTSQLRGKISDAPFPSPVWRDSDTVPAKAGQWIAASTRLPMTRRMS